LLFKEYFIHNFDFFLNLFNYPRPGKKKKDKKGKDKHSQNGTHSKSSSKEVAAAAAGQIPPISPPVGQHFQRPSVSKLPSLSRVGKPVELLVTLTRPDDLVQALIYGRQLGRILIN
jgi:hypothetical protein